MNHASRNVLTATRKRKDREDSSFFNQHSTKGTFGKPYKLQQHQQQQPPLNTTSSSSSSAQPVPVHSNRLLAGYMAYEFLSQGTLFGQKFDPARAEAVPLAAKKPGSERPPEPVKPNRSYAEVAQLLKTDGAHIPGIVNPTQLAKWIQM
uniref:Embryo sac development arrest 6 n=1 Tax=Opuntia streptacantha TaxID=393608 RepID=A0A7C8Z218_OPUST